MLRLFTSLPSTEKVINYYSCALQSDILLHGTLYISSNHIAFYSKIFYHVNKVLIQSHQIKRVEKVRTAKFIPNGIGVYMHDGRRLIFGSLLSRDATYSLLLKVATAAGGIVRCDTDTPHAHENQSVEETTSTSGQSQTDQEGQSILLSSRSSSSSSSSTPPTVHSPRHPPLAHQSSSTSLDKVDKVQTAPMAEEQGDEVDGTAFLGQAETKDINLYRSEENDSSSEEHVPAPAVSRSKAPASSKSASNHHLERTARNRVRRSISFDETRGKTSLFGEIWRTIFSVLATPHSTVAYVIVCCVLAMLFVSSGLLMSRLQRLSDELTAFQIGPGLEHSSLVELQHRLHSTAAAELEKALAVQLHHLSVVRQSLNKLAHLFTPRSFDAARDGGRPPPEKDSGA